MQHDPTSLLNDAQWLRSLARRLTTDARLAEDVAQDAWAIVLERPRRPGPLRGLLATLARRRVGRELRDRARRAEREQRAARAEAEPSAHELVARAAAQRDLANAVLALDEPYRSCVLLRFYEGLSVRQIAARQRVSVEAAESRLRRALADLRRALEGKHGRESWLSGAIPLAWGAAPNPIHVPLLGALVVNATKVALALVLVTLILVAAWFARREPERSTAVETTSSASAEPSATTSTTSDVVAAAAVDETLERSRAEVDRPSATQAAPPIALDALDAPDAPDRRLRGRVVDDGGLGVEGVAIAFVTGSGASERAGASGSQGAFDAAIPSGATSLVSEDERWATVLAASASVAKNTRPILVVAPRIALEGEVVDELGAPIAEVAIEVFLPSSIARDLGSELEHSLNRAWLARSDDGGRFAFETLPSVAGAWVRAERNGYSTAQVELPPSGGHLRIALARPGEHGALVSGIVVDANGRLVQGARVSAGISATSTDASGRFALDVSLEHSSPRIVAALRGFLPAVLDVEQVDGKPDWPSSIVLRLGKAALAIRGRVVGEDGGAIAGARVWAADVTLFEVADDVVALETLLGRDDRPFWAFVETDTDGRFELGGLLEREYTLRAVDPRSLALVEERSIDAGREGVELVLPTSQIHPRVRGRVVTLRGDPVPEASVVVQRPALEVVVPGGTRDEYTTRAPVVTGHDGSFELVDVPRDGVELFATGDRILFAYVLMRPDVDPSDVVIRASLRVHVEIELAPPHARADAIQLLDASGKALPMRVMRGNTSYTRTRVELVDGRTETLAVSEAATTLVLRSGELEVARQPLALSADGLNRVWVP